MSRSVNKVILIGNLGAAPEVKNLPSGGIVANIRLATTDTWNDRQTGQRQERTEWHNLVMFNKLGEIAGNYLKKGSKIYIEGRLQTRKWQAQDGSDRYTTEIVCNDMQMLDGNPNGHQTSGNSPAQNTGYGAPQGGYAGQGHSPSQNVGYGQAQSGGYGQAQSGGYGQSSQAPAPRHAPSAAQPQPAMAGGRFDEEEQEILF